MRGERIYESEKGRVCKEMKEVESLGDIVEGLKTSEQGQEQAGGGRGAEVARWFLEGMKIVG